MGWFGCKHNWDHIAVFHYNDTSYASAGVASTCITSKCLKCGEITTKNHYGSGHIALDALKNFRPKVKTQPNLKIVK